MGLTRDFLKFSQVGTCNLIGSPNGAIEAIDNVTCSVIAAENVSFYNLRTLEKINEIRREAKIVTAFKLNANKSAIAIGYNDGELHLHKRNEEDSQAVFAGHRTGVNCIAFSSDGFVLATGGKDSVIVLWDIVNESGLFRLSGHKGTITHLQFVQNNRYLISSSKDSQIKCWSTDSKTCFYTLAESTSEIYTFALLNNDRLLLIGNAEIELLLFELHWRGQPDWDALDGEADELVKKRTRGDGDMEAAIDVNKTDEFLNQANQILKCRKRGTLMRQAKGRALQLSVSSDEAIICCLGADSLMDVYRHFTEEESKKRFNKKLRKIRQRIDAEDQTTIKKLEADVGKDITTLVTRIGDFRADSKIKWVDLCDAFTISDDGKQREYRLYCLLKSNDVQGVSLRVDWKSNAVEATSLASLGQQRAHRTDVRTLSISSTGGFFVSGSQESAIVWDMEEGFSLRNKFVADGMAQISASLIVSDDKAIVLGTRNGSIFFFNLQSCELIEAHENAHQGAITQFCAVPNRSQFLSCGHDKNAKFWTLENIDDFRGQRQTIQSKCVLELPDEALCAAISPNGKYVAFGLLDNTARVYYADSLKFFVSLYGHSLPIHSIDISPDSKLVITGSGDKSVKIWGLDFGDCHKSLFAHDDVVTSVRFCKEDGEERLFWSAGKDGKLKQWDAIKFQYIQSLEGHSDQIDAIAFSSDGNFLISASRDKSIRIWKMTDEIIVVQEEEQRKREQEYEQKLLDEEDIIPGETKDTEGDIAPLKTIETVKSTESLIEAIEILRRHNTEKEQEDQGSTRHVLLKSYSVNSEHIFILDTLQKIRPSHLEKSLLALPFSYVGDLLMEIGKCMRTSAYKQELATKVVLFLLRVNHNQFTHSLELLPLIDELKTLLPAKINNSLKMTGLNIAALTLLQRSLEERQSTKLFDLNAAEHEKETKKRRRAKRKDVAVINPLRF